MNEFLGGYMTFSPIDYAKAAARAMNGKVIVNHNIENAFNLPNPCEYDNGDIFINCNGIYGLFHDGWHHIATNEGLVCYDSEPIEIPEKPNTSEWLALLED